MILKICYAVYSNKYLFFGLNNRPLYIKSHIYWDPDGAARKRSYVFRHEVKCRARQQLRARSHTRSFFSALRDNRFSDGASFLLEYLTLADAVTDGTLSMCKCVGVCVCACVFTYAYGGVYKYATVSMYVFMERVRGE